MSQVGRNTGTSAFTNPDCRGGTGNFDPVVSGNVVGDLGISIAAGGAAGGGGSAAQGFVGVDDTPADSILFGTVILTASGTRNRIDGRFGDYFTVRTNARCQVAYVGTNYSLLNGNTLPAHVNARYVEFGSTLDSACFSTPTRGKVATSRQPPLNQS